MDHSATTMVAFGGWELFFVAALLLVLFGIRGTDWKVWIAQGFDSGRIPVAPGTFGTVVGFFWFFVLVATGNFFLFLLGTLAGVGVSVWLCGEAERKLNQTDPGSIVLDEIIAVPICFIGWICLHMFHHGEMPGMEFIQGEWVLLIGVFLAFRFFDVLKPWPVKSSQSLPGGWGVTADDVLAAVYVNGVVLVVGVLCDV